MTFSVFKSNYFTLLNRSVITLVNHRKRLSDMSAKSESGRRIKITVFLPSDNIRPKSQSIGYIIRRTFKNYFKPCNMVQNYNGFILLAKTMPEMTPADHWLLESETIKMVPKSMCLIHKSQLRLIIMSNITNTTNVGPITPSEMTPLVSPTISYTNLKSAETVLHYLHHVSEVNSNWLNISSGHHHE